MKKFLSILVTVLLLFNMSISIVATPSTSVHLKTNDGATASALKNTTIAVLDMTVEELDDLKDGASEDLLESLSKILWDSTNNYYYVEVNQQNGNSPQLNSTDFAIAITEYVDYFVINGIRHDISDIKGAAPIYEGTEGGGTINYWLDELLTWHTVGVSVVGDEGSATWTQNSFVDLASANYVTHSNVPLTFAPTEGYYITSVTLDGTPISDTTWSSDSITDIGDNHAYVIYTEMYEYDVDVEYVFDGDVMDTGGSSDHGYGSTFEEAIEEHTGYYITDITLQGVSTGLTSGPVSIENIQEDQLIRVYLEIYTFPVSVEYVYPDLSTAPGYSGTWDYGDTGTVSLDAYDTVTYTQTDVTLDMGSGASSIGKNVSYTINAITTGYTFVVYLEERVIPPVLHTVVITGDTGATFDGDGTYEEGFNITPTFGAMEGYRLVNITKSVDEGSASDLGAVTSDPITGIANNYVYYVETIKEYDVEVVADPTGTLNTPAETVVTYDEGTEISRTFTPVAGRKIVSIDVTYDNDGLVTDHLLTTSEAAVTTFTHNFGEIHSDILYEVVTVPFYTVELVLDGDLDSAVLTGFEGEALEGEVLDYDFEAADHYDIYRVTVEHGGSTDELVAVDSLEDLVEYLIDGIDEDYVITVYTVKEEYTVTIVSDPEDTIDEDGYSQVFAYLSDETVTFTVKSGWQIDNVKLNGEYQGAITSFDIEDIDEDMDFIVYTSLIPTYGISLDKSSVVSESNLTAKGTFDIGDTVTYLFVIKNLGNQAMDYLFFEDEDLGVTKEFTEGLAPAGEEGDTITFTLTTSYSSSGNKVNHAYVEAYDYTNESEEPDSHAEDTHTVTIRQPYTPPRTVYYTLTLGSTDGGDFDLFEGSRTFPAGTVVDVSYSIEDGYYFVGYSETSDDADVVNNRITMNSNKTLFISFDLEDIPEEVIPEGVPEEIFDEEITQGAPEIPDEPLPQTGGLPMAANMVVGALVSFAGLGLRRGKLK